jgi:hypothetical protein
MMKMVAMTMKSAAFVLALPGTVKDRGGFVWSRSVVGTYLP